MSICTISHTHAYNYYVIVIYRKNKFIDNLKSHYHHQVLRVKQASSCSAKLSSSYSSSSFLSQMHFSTAKTNTKHSQHSLHSQRTQKTLNGTIRVFLTTHFSIQKLDIFRPFRYFQCLMASILYGNKFPGMAIQPIQLLKKLEFQPSHP